MSRALPKLSGDKIVPHSEEAEQAFLGALLVDPDAIYKVIDRIKPEMFYLERHATIYTAYREMLDANTEINMVSLEDKLDQAGALEEIGGPAYISKLILMCPSALQIRSYTDIIDRTFRLRRAINGAREIVIEAFEDDADPTEVEGKILDLYASISQETLAVVQDANTAVDEMMTTIKDKREHPEKWAAWKSPWKALTDRAMGGKLKGLHPKDFVIIAGRPGMGKTAMAMQWGHWLAEHDIPGAVFSLEMTTYNLLCREAARRMDIPVGDLIDAELEEKDYPRLIQAAGEMRGLPIHYDETAGLALTTFAGRLRHLSMTKGIKWVIVDYMQLLISEGAKGENRQNEIARISRTLKVLAKDLDICIIATAQLNRGLESRLDKRPALSDLRESGQIEQDADLIMFIYRDDYYNEDSDTPNIAEIIIGKYRNGQAPATSALFWKGATTSFVDLELKKLDDMLEKPGWNVEPPESLDF